MAWVYGGVYLSGSNSDAMYDGGSLAAATGTVVVTVNYRLGALGFLRLADLLGAGYEDSSNLGLLDLVKALRWVQSNKGASVLSGAGVPRAPVSGYAGALTRLLGREPPGKELLRHC